MTDSAEQNNITQVRVDIGELKGILNTVVISHGGLIKELQESHKNLRNDLTAVKDNASSDLNSVAVQVTTNSAHIAAVRDDVRSLNDKQNATFGKTVMIASPLVAVVALLWNVLGSR